MSDSSPTEVGIYGVGHFGYALLRHLARKGDAGLRLRGFDQNDEVRATLGGQRRHPYYEYDPEHPLGAEVRIVDGPDAFFDGLEIFILAVTSHSTREVVEYFAKGDRPIPPAIVSTAKALDSDTGRTLGEVIDEVLEPTGRAYSLAAFSGGTIATDMLR
ncbi:MAG: hypothetical protein VYC34_03115, partial [Planctomycetota bacterium]|nr:hypothetical protein [Planctomycetota bacterium]